MPEPQMDNTQRVIAAYKAWFTSEHGKVALDNLAKHCFENNMLHIFDVNSARKTDFNLGKNDVIRHIRCMLERKTEPKQAKVISERKIL